MAAAVLRVPGSPLGLGVGEGTPGLPPPALRPGFPRFIPSPRARARRGFGGGVSWGRDGEGPLFFPPTPLEVDQHSRRHFVTFFLSSSEVDQYSLYTPH